MKLTDFAIGMTFSHINGNRYLCTDIGTRSVLAICIEDIEPDLFRGLPYLEDEITFDEIEIRFCFTDDHPYDAYEIYPHTLYFPPRQNQHYYRYPRKKLLRCVKLLRGEKIYPYAVELQNGAWMIHCKSEKQRLVDLMEREFVDLPDATKR